MHHYPHHISDFNNATRHLSRDERGIYRDLLDLYYDTEEPLPNDIKFIARKVLATDERSLNFVATVLAEFFTLTKKGYENHKCNEIIKAYQSSTSQRSEAGKASAKARRELKAKGKKDSTGDDNPLQRKGNEDSTFVHNLEPRTKNLEPLTGNQEPNDDSGPVIGIGEFDEYVESKRDNNSLSTETDYKNGYKKITGWELAPETHEMLTVKYQIPEKFIDEELDSFTQYWFDCGGEKLSWDSAFLKQCQAQWKRNGGQWTDAPTKSIEQESADVFDKFRSDPDESQSHGT